MAIAKMHRQRTVNRAFDKVRFTKQRKITRGGRSGDTGASATGATAGIPGAWTPASATAPSSVAALIAGSPNTVTASPAGSWTPGQYVQTRTAGVPGRAHWNGTAWVSGAKP